MDSNPFDQFDSTPEQTSGNPFDKFDTSAPKERPVGRAEKFITNVARGALSGPLGVIGAATQEGLDTASETADKAAYAAGGKATDIAANVTSPESAAKVGLATNVAVQALPAIVGGEAAKLLSPAFKNAGRELMQSALKPTIAQLRTGKAATAINTMLEEGLNVTKGGVSKLREKIGQLNTEIKDAISNSSAVVDKGKVASYLQDAIKKFNKQVNPNSDIASIEKAWTEFLQHPLLSGKQDIPVQLAQEMKTSTYKALGDKSYGELKGADIEAQKTLARGLKEEISRAVPAININALNAEESRLLQTLNVTERRVLMDSNKNPMGLSLIADTPTKILGFLADRSPVLKSIIARMLYSGSEQIPATAGRGLGAIGGMTEGRQD